MGGAREGDGSVGCDGGGSVVRVRAGAAFKVKDIACVMETNKDRHALCINARKVTAGEVHGLAASLFTGKFQVDVREENFIFPV